MAPIPKPQSAMTDASRFPTTEWYNFLSDLQALATSDDAQEIAAILARLTALENAPGPTLEQGPGIRVLGQLAEGYAQVRLATLIDSEVGAALVKITRDGYGRIAGTEAATTDDLAEGSNLYYTDERADARIDAWLGTLVSLTDAVDDAAAAIAGVAVGEMYRNGSVLMVRIT